MDIGQAWTLGITHIVCGETMVTALVCVCVCVSVQAERRSVGEELIASGKSQKK